MKTGKSTLEIKSSADIKWLSCRNYLMHNAEYKFKSVLIVRDPGGCKVNWCCLIRLILFCFQWFDVTCLLPPPSSQWTLKWSQHLCFSSWSMSYLIVIVPISQLCSEQNTVSPPGSIMYFLWNDSFVLIWRRHKRAGWSVWTGWG